MKKEEGKPAEEGYTAPAFVAPAIGDRPPVGAWIDKDAVCRDCMKAVEEITMRRGFIDAISVQEAQEKGVACARCGKKIGAIS